MKKMILFLILLLNCDIASSGDIFILEVEHLEGAWYGATKVESQIQPGYYTNRPVTISIKDRDSTMYSLKDTFNISIQEQISKDQVAITHFGYITGIEEEYEEYLTGTLHKTVLTGTSNYTITFTKLSDDSLRIQFSTYDFKVRN